MKNLILLLSVFLGTMATAQNWSLVMPNDTLVYEKQDNNQFFTVWVDSVEVNGMDTTYFMNRISPGEVIGQGNDSDVCVNPYQFASWESVSFREFSRPQFCGATIRATGSKSIVSFPQFEFVIYPNNSVGSIWISDSVLLDSMKIISAGISTIPAFQVQDSIKVFELNGKTFTLSKNHGIISNINLKDTLSPSFDLVGVQNLWLGDLIPMYPDFFDYSVGDIFVRLYLDPDVEGPYMAVSKHKITSKTTINDTLVYDYLDYNTNSVGNLKYWKEMNPFLNAYPNTISTCKTYYFPGSEVIQNNSRVLVIRNDSGQIQKRTVPIIWNLTTDLFGYCDSINFIVEYYSYGPIAVYQKGLEPILEGISSEEGALTNSLIGYIKDGVPYGDTTSVAELDYSNLINIYPNPTNSILHITTEKINGISILEMYDLRGQLIITKTFDTNLKLDVSQWSNGFYFAIIKNTDGSVLHREKVVIQ